MFHDFQLIVSAPIAQVFYKRYSAFVKGVTSGAAPKTKMAFVKADGSETEISVADGKKRLAGLLERAAKAGLGKDADAKVAAAYAKAAK
jgi:hypothetical protein